MTTLARSLYTRRREDLGLFQAMASCLWRYRCRILLCICTPCILLGCLFIYITLALCLAMAHTYPSDGQIISSKLPNGLFVATGTTKANMLASYPIQPFWRQGLNNAAFWNLIQHVMDRQHNPILQASGNISHKHNITSLNQTGCFPSYEGMRRMSDYFTQPLQIQKFIISMHCRVYPLLIDQPGLCAKTEEAPMLLLAIKSLVPNFRNRQAIRMTWGYSGLLKGQVGKGGLVRRVFLLGKIDEELSESIKKESEMYDDIILWDFMDTFFNLTLKDVLFWDWYSKRCQNARFVLKGDDDVFVRTPALLDYLENQEKLHLKRHGHAKKMEDFVVGDIITSAFPLRLETNKYYIPESFYKGMYPTYPGGGGVVYSGALVPRLLQVSRRVHLFPIDDVYLGMCLQRLGVIPINHPAFLTFDFNAEEAKEPCAHHTILLVHKRSPEEMLKLWTETLRPNEECRNTTLRIEEKQEEILLE
ncbi:N-acetyllactosaminide beta-1,3-N-acetylglucosaminyltransferase 2 isoform X2 [Pangasianodon hypophthalmus]|uniref:N-acetyllactosaminide beta-1,3-N-acetylglucosaminyltransferase 2 isoform X2 n=1 Tax=Pangasianodon hypophthalmus TaxID=310915 RepID=UPI002306EDD3|nr:N-acetyllactosaminide beta-1,3-N-acetylglucosaminyltransferase 2 isoform X2 [Pangasianodon hypophthalmus]